MLWNPKLHLSTQGKAAPVLTMVRLFLSTGYLRVDACECTALNGAMIWVKNAKRLV